MPLTEAINDIALAKTAAEITTAIRNSIRFILVSAVNGSLVIPGWSTSVVSTATPAKPEEPDQITLSYTDGAAVTWRIRVNYTWNSGLVVGMVVQLDDGGGTFETVTGGTLTLTYDGDGNFTGATSA